MIQSQRAGDFGLAVRRREIEIELPERSAEIEIGLAEGLREGGADGVVDAEAQEQVGAVEIVGFGCDDGGAGGVGLAHESEHGVGD